MARQPDVRLRCGDCLEKFSRRPNQVKRDAEEHYCSRRCSGRAGRRLRKTGKPPTGPVHGTAVCYQYFKCRCAECREANRLKMARYRLKRRQAQGALAR